MSGHYSNLLRPALVAFEVPGPAMPWERATPSGSGTTAAGKVFTRMVKPARTRAYEELVGWCGRQAMVGRQMLDGPCWMHLAVFIELPKAASAAVRKRVAAGEVIFCDKRPDGSNYVKAVEDGLNGIVFTDDGRVACGSWVKRYCVGNPRAVVSIGALDDGQRLCQTPQA